ncbi:MAG: glycosyltransferase [Propionicimonas sp.]|nr:glycosyltransferase [Propionicimonas sp.]
MTRRILILAAGVGSGHNQAAGAIEQALAGIPDAGEVRRLDILETTNSVFNRLYDDAYFALVSEVPWLVGWGYDQQDPPFRLAPLVQWWDQLNTLPLVREIRDYDPDLVICTHFLPARMVSLMLARGHLQATLTIVATDYDFQGLWLTSPFSHFFVARDETRTYLNQIGVPADRVSVSGIPVGPDLAEPVDAAAVRQRFGLDPDLPVVLVSAGAAGGPYTLQVVRQVLRCEQQFQTVVVCGRNEELKTQVDELVAEGSGRFRVLGYTTEMPDLMRIACLFVGKPGGLSSSECMAAGLPMVLIKPIPGQEVRNADYLLEEGAAVRCNYATTVGYKIDHLLAAPERLATMAANARRIGFPQAARTIAERSLAVLAPPLWIGRDAQKSISKAGEDGIAAADLDTRLRTLHEPDTGASLAVLTEEQLGVVGVTPLTRSIELDLPAIKALRWQPENLDLAAAGKWLLGDTPSREFSLD